MQDDNDQDDKFNTGQLKKRKIFFLFSRKCPWVVKQMNGAKHALRDEAPGRYNA